MYYNISYIQSERKRQSEKDRQYTLFSSSSFIYSQSRLYSVMCITFYKIIIEPAVVTTALFQLRLKPISDCSSWVVSMPNCCLNVMVKRI